MAYKPHPKKNEILALIQESLAKYVNTEVLATTVSEKYGIGRRQAYRYIKKVRDMWANEGDLSPERRAAYKSQLRHAAWREIREAGSSRDRIAAMNFLAKLDGHNEPDRSAVDIQASGNIVLTPGSKVHDLQAIDSEIDRLLQKRLAETKQRKLLPPEDILEEEDEDVIDADFEENDKKEDDI